MAFKSFSQYQEEKNGDFFVLPNDGDFADVVFLYRSTEDVLIADVHYISSPGYKGYAHCCGTGCPACSYGERGIRLDHKLFIPLYNIQKNKIEFWDRSPFFESVLQKAVFAAFPNPSETVFRVTRHGEANSRDTKYDIQPIGRNSARPYEKILADFNMTLPDGYSMICKEMTVAEMSSALNSTNGASELQDYGYTPVPRGQEVAPAPEVTVPTPEYSAPPEIAPPSVDLPEYSEGMPAVEQVSAEEISAEVKPAEDDSEDSLDDVKF